LINTQQRDVADRFIRELPGYSINRGRAEELSHSREDRKNVLLELNTAITQYENSKLISALRLPSEPPLLVLMYWIREALFNGIVVERRDEGSVTGGQIILRIL
jgi:hypothetical protein